ncbi:hypothetical protein [Hymenobacter sp. BRD67]|uniref:hypothetical protein n=1 Tax=Hymenobacter sp. BRD67 TaxID=2675877 RepID=UPI0015636F2B|nr:hypothetical protein [Hymenobacter sp. BRD67]QKG55040.1 hypothetical protein GKZ67_21690 [Hymenobacter sp. BRD67]
MNKSVFMVAKMDCPAEEQLIRLHFSGNPAVAQLQFDLAGRQLTVLHTGAVAPLTQALDRLNLGSALVDTTPSIAPTYGRKCPATAVYCGRCSASMPGSLS